MWGIVGVVLLLAAIIGIALLYMRFRRDWDQAYAWNIATTRAVIGQDELLNDIEKTSATKET
jgi:hypothetical protein